MPTSEVFSQTNMKIGIEAIAANKEIRTGVGSYAYELLEAMKPLSQNVEEVFLYTSRSLIDPLSKLPGGWVSRVLSWPLPGWSTIRLNIEMLFKRPDVVFFPSSIVSRFAPTRRNKKHATVTTIHDVGFARAPHLYSRSDARRQRKAIRHAVRKCDHLLTISEFSKREIVEVYNVPEDRITVTPLAVDTKRYKPASAEEVRLVRQKNHLSQNYLLFVSRIDRKKNIETLIRAFTIFKQARGFGDPHELVIVGPSGFGAQEIKKLISESVVKDSIKLLGPVSEEDKIALYSGAIGCVNFSWYEGFGLTPLEAAACGTASLLSEIPAHREVMEDGAMYVSPKAADAIAPVLKHFVEESSARENLLVAAKKRLEFYTWQRTAELTFEALRGATVQDGLLDVKA